MTAKKHAHKNKTKKKQTAHSQATIDREGMQLVCEKKKGGRDLVKVQNQN